MLPTILGFSRMTELHCEGQRKSKVVLVKGVQLSPPSPQLASSPQNASVQSTYDEAGVKNELAREKKANPMM